MRSKLIATFPADTKNYVLNIYKYRFQLVGIIEDPHYLQIYEIPHYLTPTDYIDWRFSVYWPCPLLDIHGIPFQDQTSFEHLRSTAIKTGIPIFRFHNL